jgi:hypothetical protein
MLLDQGSYEAVAVEAGLGKAGTGTIQLAIRFELTQAPHVGRSLTWYGPCTEAAIERTVESGSAAGWDWGKRELMKSPPKVFLAVEVEERETESGTREQNRVAFVNARPALHIKNPLDDQTAERLSKAALNILKSKSTKAGGKNRDDDISF